MSGPELPKIGFIGLGSQGAPMAMRIAQAGFPLTVWARRKEALAPFVAKGAVAAGSAAELGEACSHIGVCVLDDAGVAEICAQLLPAMRPGALLAIHSTILPESCERLAVECAARGIVFLDAPVSGGAPAAEAGTLTVMCGGTQAAFDQARPVFASFALHCVLLGPAGAGQRAKIINNALLAANMGMAHAAFAAAATLGIERGAFAELIKQSSGRSFGFEICARLPSPEAFALGAPLLVKDVNLLDAILPAHDGAGALYEAASGFLSAAAGQLFVNKRLAPKKP